MSNPEVEQWAKYPGPEVASIEGMFVRYYPDSQDETPWYAYCDGGSGAKAESMGSKIFLSHVSKNYAEALNKVSPETSVMRRGEFRVEAMVGEPAPVELPGVEYIQHATKQVGSVEVRYPGGLIKGSDGLEVVVVQVALPNKMLLVTKGEGFLKVYRKEAGGAVPESMRACYRCYTPMAARDAPQEGLPGEGGMHLLTGQRSCRWCSPPTSS